MTDEKSYIQRMNLFPKKYLTRHDLRQISEKIAEVENFTSGEIRVCVRRSRSWRERKLSLRELALAEFRRLGMHKTNERTGVLILLLLSERKFEIVGDEGIHTIVPEGTWDKVAADMSAHFKEGKFAHGITRAIETVGEHLRAHFPKRPDDRNELSNDVVER